MVKEGAQSLKINHAMPTQQIQSTDIQAASAADSKRKLDTSRSSSSPQKQTLSGFVPVMIAIGVIGILLALGSMSSVSMSSEPNSSTVVTPATSAQEEVPEHIYIIYTDDVDYFPFEYTNANGDLEGIDIDIFRAIAADQGFDYELSAVGFEAALEGAISGQADGALCDISITPERSEILDFSDPYFYEEFGAYGFAVPKGQNPELLEMFNEGLAHIQENGTYDSILERYL